MISTLERFKGICRFERCNDPFLWHVDGWYETYERWQREGMPISNLNMKDLNRYFLGYENQTEAIHPNSCLIGMGPCHSPPWVPPLDPMFETTILDMDKEHITRVDYDGCVVRIRRDNPRAMPQYLEYPVKDKETWDEYKKRLDPYSNSRFPEGWTIMSEETMGFYVKPEQDGKSFEERDFPLGMMALSLWGMPRNYMGLEGISYAMFDNPKLIEEMVEYQAWYAVETIKQVFAAGITLDWAFIWEDMCFNKGSLISPDFVKRVMSPHYKNVIRLLRDNGVEMVMLDCDGNTWDLLPIWVDSGVNCTFPMEVASGMDALAVRKYFGKDLIMIGNIDKRSIAKGKAYIDKEVLKVKELIKDGGYFVSVDHQLPPDVPFENVVYFLNEVNMLSDYEDTKRLVKI